jgi:chromosome segregation ATPase
MAESAFAASGAYYEQTLPLQSQTQLGTGSVLQPSSFLGQKLQTKWSSNLPNSTDIDTLESTLSSYKSQLATLKAKTPKDPKVQASLDVAISALESDIETLEDAITNLKATFKLLTNNKLTLSAAIDAYNQAIVAKTKAAQDLDAATSSRLLTLNTKSEKQNKLDNLSAALTSTQTANDDAAAEVATATLILDRATAALSKATTDRQTAQTDYDAAAQLLNTKLQLKSSKQAAFEAAVLDYKTYIQNTGNAVNNLSTKELYLLQAQSALEIAQQEYEQSNSALTTISSELSLRQAEYNSAHESTQQVVSEYNELINAYTTVYNNYLAKQSAFQTAQVNLNTAQQNLDTAQYNYDNNLIQDPSAPPVVVSPGLTVKVYNQLPTSNPQRSDTAYNLCKTTTLTKIENNWGGGDILGCGGDRVMIHYTGYLTPGEDITYLMNQADDGFYMDLNGTNVINNWYLKGCGGNWNSVSLQKGKSYYIDAWFYEWGGGACSTLYYQSNTNWGVVPAAWYTTNQPAPMIKDPALLVLLQEAQGEYNEALAAYTTANAEWNQAQIDQQVAAQATIDGYYLVIGTAESENTAYATLQEVQGRYNSQLTITNQYQSTLSSAEQVVAAAQAEVITANNVLNDAIAAEADAQAHYESTKAEHEAAIEEADLALAAKTAASSTLLAATDTLSTATSEEQSASTVLASKKTALGNADALLIQATTSKDQAVTELQQATVEADTAEANFQTATAALNAADFALTTATTNKTVSEEKVATAEVSLTETNNSVQKVSNISFQEVEQLLTKEPDPEPEGSAEIPPVIEDLMEVDLKAVDPTELTSEQAQQLVEAALVVFETATEGSPEYQQALDALYLAAQEDDIQVDPALAEIPGIGQAAEAVVAALNIIGNVGADISPKARKKAQTLVVTTLVVGQIAQTAALATATASSGSSSRTIRRK